MLPATNGYSRQLGSVLWTRPGAWPQDRALGTEDPPEPVNSLGAKRGRPPKADPNAARISTPESYRGGIVGDANPRREYVAKSNSAAWSSFKDYLTALPRATDDLDRELGTDTVRRMLQNPQLNSSLYLIALACLSRGLQIKPRITDTKDPRYAAAVEMQKFIQYNLDGMEHSYTEMLLDMIIGALSVGNAVAEQNYKLKVGGTYDGKIVLSTIKNKPPEVYCFLQDKYGNVPAIATYTGDGDFNHPLRGTTQPSNLILPSSVQRKDNNQEVAYNNLPENWTAIPISKFAVLTYRQRYFDPRGQSALRAAYSAWYVLMQMWPEYLKYLTQFASPAIVGTLPEKVTPTYDPDTQEVLDPLDVLYTELLNFANGTVLALRFGSEVDLKFSNGDGTAFVNAINLLNHEMVKAILHQLLATEEGKNGNRAMSGTHQDILNVAVRGLKNLVVSMVQRQIFRPLIAMNFGENAAEMLTPLCSLGDIAQEDKSDMVRGYSLGGYKIGPSQWPAIDAELELEVRDAATAQKDYDDANKANQAQNQPFGGGNPKQNKDEQKPGEKRTGKQKAMAFWHWLTGDDVSDNTEDADPNKSDPIPDDD
jgi:hypothetical protein